jgi:hypothetical protein
MHLGFMITTVIAWLVNLKLVFGTVLKSYWQQPRFPVLQTNLTRVFDGHKFLVLALVPVSMLSVP